MKKITFLLFALLFSFFGYSQFPTPGTEGFENTTGLDIPLPTPSSPWTLGTGVAGNQWAVFDNGVAGTPQRRWDRTVSNVYAGTQSAFINRKQNGGAGIISQDFLATPLITVPANGQLTFWTRTGFNVADAVDYLIKVNTITTAGSQTTAANYTNTVQSWNQTNLVAIYNAYELKTVDLSAYAGQQVYLAFVRVYTQPAAALSGNSWYIDDVKIVQQCIAPASTSLTATNITATSASLSWAASGSTSWEIEVVPPGGTQTGVGNIYSGSLPYVVTGLTPDTAYIYYVRSICLDGNSSWAGPYSFHTIIPPLGCGSTFLDSGGTSANYSLNENITTTICATNLTDLVTVTFTAFNVENNFDFLKVYDGNSSAGPLLGTYTGTTIPPALTSSTPGGCLTFVFTSDGSVTKAGWVATITCAPAPTCSKPTGLAVNSILSTSATLTWTQGPNPGGGSPSAWQVLALPCSAAAPTASSTGWQAATGTTYTISGLSPTTCYNFYVRAACSISDISSWSSLATGTTQALPPVCGGNFVDSGGASGNYSNSENITTTICATNSTDLVTVSFTAFDVENNFDFLKVYDGNSSAGPLLGTYTGTTIPPDLTSSTPGGCLTFVFTSDSTINHSGWVATVVCAPAPTCSKPMNLITPIINGNSITYSWNQPANPDTSIANNWKVIILPCGSPTPTASTPGWINSNSTTYVATGLTTSTCYDFYVMAVCSGTDSSPIKSLLGTNTTCGSQQASPSCTNAPPVCLLQGYCGNTSSDYSPTHTWTELTSAFSSCLGGASIDNNSFIDFQATSTTAQFNIYVYNSLNNDGVQFFAFEAVCNGTTVTPKGCSLVAPTGAPGVGTPVTFNMTGLVPGNSYHLMFDGYAGDICDYQVIPINGVATTVDVTPASPTICSGQSVVLTASGGNNTYSWSPSTGLSATSGTVVTANPSATTTYTVTSSSTTVSACPVTKSVTIVVNPLTPSVTDFSYSSPVCISNTIVLPILSTGFTAGGTYTSTPGLDINSTTGEINLNNSTANTYVVTYSITANPTICRSANSSTSTITIKNSITPLFNTPPPICTGTPAPVLPTSSINLPTAITGSWTPAVVSNTASATYTFNPDPGQCAAPTNVQVTVNNICLLGSYASAVWLTNCATSNFFNTVGSGPDLIGPVANVFTNTDFGIFVQNSNNFTLRGAEVKTFKGASSNVCSARLNYRVYPATTTPGAFQVMDLPWFEDCTGSTFPSGGPCTPGDQKWQRVVANGTTTPYAPVNLTAYPPGNYVLQVYYDLTGSESSASGCNQNFLVDNNGAYFTATYTIQANPSYTNTNPTTCGGVNGSITISGMEPSTTFGISYQLGTTPFGPLNLVSDASGQITITGLTAGNYSNFSITLNNCVYPYTTPIVLVDPVVPTVTVNSPTECSGTLATITATPGSAATYSYAWTCPSGFTNPGDVATFTTSASGVYSVVITNTVTGCSSTNASGTVTINPIITPTFNAIAPLCTGSVAPILPTTSTNTPTSISGTWSPSVVSNTASGTYTFTPNAGQCSQPVPINVTVNSVPVPVVSILTQPTCAVPTGSVEVTSPLSVTGGVAPTDLFISEATDSNSGSLSYVELYNGTGASINLSNYTIKTANNGGAYGFSLPLNNVSLASGSSYVVALGNDGSCSSTPGGDGSFGAQSSGSGSVNFIANGNDQYGLFNGTTLIDSWGEFGNNNWAPSNIGDRGADFRRKNNVTPLPNPTFSNNDWDIIDYAGNTAADCANNDYSNIGVYSMNTTATTNYQYNVDGGAYQTSPIFTGLTPGTHDITVQDMLTGCISIITTVTINNPPASPTASVNSPSVCGVNATVTATPGSPGTYSYVWTVPSGATNPGNVDTFTATVSGVYSVVITNTATGCSSTSASGTVTIKAIPTVTVSNPTVCGVSSPVTATPGIAGTYSYVWTVPSGSNPGNVASFTATVSGTYSVVITNTTTGCTSTSASGLVTINAIPTVTVNSSVVCNGSSSTVTATPGTTGTYSYSWTVPTGAINPGNVASFTSTVAGTYSVIITNTVTSCVSTSASGTITFVPSFDYTLFGECVDNNYTLEILPSGSSFDLNTSNFAWTVNSTTTTLGTNSTFNATAYFSDPAVTTQMPATFNVNVTTADGCQQSHSIIVDRVYCDIQKGISPNDDTKNDFFDLRLMNVQQLEIFNRYGTKVYSKMDYSNEWIGQSNSGSELPDGTYYYVIEFKNNQPTKTGWIYINRDSK